MRALLLLFSFTIPVLAFLQPQSLHPSLHPSLRPRSHPSPIKGWLDDAIDFVLGNDESTANLGDYNDGRSDKIIPAMLVSSDEEELREKFDGRYLREIIVRKWQEDYDVEFKRTDYMGNSALYLNITPWSLGKKPFRHENEQEYLEHLQAVAELLIKYNSVREVIDFIAETKKAPRRGTVPVLMVSIRLPNVSDEQVKAMRA